LHPISFSIVVAIARTLSRSELPMRDSLSHVRVILVAAAILLGVSAASPVLSQDETESLSGAATSWLGTPPASDCLVEAATVDAIVEPLTTPAAAEEAEFPLTVPTEADLPAGEPASEEDVAAASATLWHAVACLNAGEFGKFFAFLSPVGVRAFFLGITALFGGEPAPPTAEDIEEIRVNLTSSLSEPATPVAEADQARIDRIRDARILPGGRLLFVIDGTLGTDASLYMVFSPVEAGWLIDAFGQIGIFE
jgi:hypothetical protein